MFCSNCGNTVDASKKFCHVCGFPIQKAADENYDSPTEFTENPGTQNANAASQSEAGYTQSAMADYGYQNSSEALYDKQPKKKNLKKLLIPVIAIVLVAVIALGGWGIFLSANPEVRIAKAAEKTLFSTKSFAVEVSYDGETLGEGYVSFGKTTFTSDFFAEIDGEKIVCDDGQLLMPLGDGSYISADLPAFFAELKEGLDELVSMVAGGGSADEIAEEINDRFNTNISPEKVLEWAENLIKNNKINEDVVAEIYNTVLVPGLAAEFDIEEGDIPNYKKLKSIIGQAFVKGINGDALEVKDTKTKNGIKYYEVEVNPIELAKGLGEFALECKDLEAILEVEVGGVTAREALEEFVEEATDYIEDDDYDPKEETYEFTVGIKNGYLVAVEFEDFEVKLTEINKKHDAKNDYEDVDGDADEVIEIEDLEQLASELMGGYNSSYDDYYDDYYNYYDDYYYYY